MNVAIVGFLGELHSIVTDVRGNFELIDTVRQSEALQKAFGSFSGKVEKTFSALQVPMAHTRLLSWAGLVSSGYKLKKAYTNPKPDKVAHSLSIALSFRTGCLATTSLFKGLNAVKIIEYTTNPYAQTAFKVATVACTPLAIVGSMLSAAVFAMEAYNFVKVKRFIAEWEKHEGDSRERMNLVKNLEPDQFEKIFRCEKSALQVDWNELSKPLSKGQRKGKNGQAVIELRKTLVSTLEKRMYRTNHLNKLNLTSVSMYAVGCWMNIFLVAPATVSLLKNSSAGLQLVSGVHQIWSTYAFTKKIEQIKKN